MIRARGSRRPTTMAVASPTPPPPMMAQSCIYSVLMVPDSPRSVSASEYVFKVLLFLKCDHTRPKTIVCVGHQFTFPDQPAEWLFNQLFSVLHIREHFLPQNHEPTVHSGT